jgi:hypothetical protein
MNVATVRGCSDERAAEAIQRFTGRYPSVEGFYVLSRTGRLSYIRKEDQRAVKETFRRWDRVLRHQSVAADVPCFSHFELAKAYQPFRRDSNWLSVTGPRSASPGASWHDHVLSTIHYDQQAIFKRTGIGNPLLATTSASAIRPAQRVPGLMS